MRVRLGVNSYLKRTEKRDVSVDWDSHTAINPHVLVVGGSGSGKTHTLRHIIQSMHESAERAVRIHVFDVHGDLEVSGASTVKFSESTSYGHNPLIIDADSDHGGVRRQIQKFIAALNRTSRQLGSRQEAVIRALLTDLYNANGFYADRSDSWRLNDGVERRYPKKYPTLLDASRFAGGKLKALYLGSNAKAVNALEQVNRKAQALYAKTKNLGQVQGDTSPPPELTKLVDEAIDAYAAAVRSIYTGRELDDLMRYDSKDVLRSVVERLESLNAVGIFRPEPPPFDPRSAVWRYDIRALSSDEKKLFVFFLLEDLFRKAVQRGIQHEVSEIIVLDESHLFFTDEPENPLNIIAKEARKFGLGMVCASQSPAHFSDDFLSNVATKILLRIDEMHWDASVRKLKIELKLLQYIIPKRTLAVQIKTSSEGRAGFVGVNI